MNTSNFFPGETPVAQVIAENIRGQRVRMGLKQWDVAKRMQALGFKWRYQTLSQVERGERSLGADELLGLTVALKTTAAVLFQAMTAAVTFPSGVTVTAQRLSIIDDSIDWDGNQPLTAATGARSPLEMRAGELRDQADFLENYRDTVKNRTETRQPAPGADPGEDAIDIPPRRRGRPRKREDQ